MNVSWESMRTKRVVMRPGRTPGDEYDFMEFEGGPDVVVEVVRPSSASKDYVRLPRAYFAAGVREFWLADARKDELVFLVHKRGRSRFEPVRPDKQGFQRSGVLEAAFRLTCRPGPVLNTLVFGLEKRP